MMRKIFLFLFAVLLINFISAAHQLPTDLSNDSIGLIEGAGDWANNVTYGSFWFLLMLGFCIVLWISTVRYGVAKAFGYAGTTGLLGGIFLLIIGWISWVYASMLIISGAASIAFMIKSKE